ncbi:MAG: hypothetical protein KDK50_00650 [Chlamydiia bacterium]|nr:hypothetical protein [Chlamydiia bacterium]MCP5491786.1 hypothetical protein [Chlamydiales bacterium]
MTLIIAIGIIGLCFVGLSIGKILTGKNKLSCKRCGKPEEKEKECSICGKKKR